MHSKTVLSFINLSRVVLDLCNGQELKVQLNKGQLLQKYSRQSQGSCALHFSLNALYQSFIQFSVVFLDMNWQSNYYLP